MPRIAYVNGAYMSLADAAVNIEDRGMQFADSVYEVTAVYHGKLFDFAPHFERLKRSLSELHIELPCSESSLRIISNELLRRNRIQNGLIYMQISRGVAPRDHAFPTKTIRPSLILTAKRFNFAALRARQEKGVGIISHPENRWNRPDIKSTSLLANVLAKQAAKSKGAFEAWFVDRDGNVTEGSSSNAWIVTKDGKLVTRGLDFILSGITRKGLLSIVKARGLTVEERAFSLQEAVAAREAFITSTSSFVTPVVAIDGQMIGEGTVGELTKNLVKWYWNFVENPAGS